MRADGVERQWLQEWVRREAAEFVVSFIGPERRGGKGFMERDDRH
jgi:hypothetical protein